MHFRLEKPRLRQITTTLTKLEGWFGDKGEIPEMRLEVNGRFMPTSTFRRTDVERVHSDIYALGFGAILDLRDFADNDGPEKINVKCTVGNAVHHTSLDVTEIARKEARSWSQVKAIKRKKIQPLLQCPICRHGDIDSEMTCTLCQAHYPDSNETCDLLPATLRGQFKIDKTDNISHHPYSKEAVEVIDDIRSRGGLILDCGAGYRFEISDDIICSEIVAYPSTDVLGVGQSLPFKDDSFEAVLSTAVLEHVTDPFLCAQEIVRVTKPGGTIFCTVPFLQPEHGYPHHYYNMTQDGLANLFGDVVEIKKKSVPQWGHPLHSLAWFLSDYHRFLPSETAANFQKLTVQELIQMRFNRSHPIFAELSEEGRRVLATSTLIVAVKR